MKPGDFSAFPCLDNNGQTGMFLRDTGLSKREYFAAMAMQGLLATHRNLQHNEINVAHWAVKNADALLAELEKERP